MWCALSPLPIVPGSRRTRKRSCRLCNLHTESCCHPDSCCEIPIPPMIFTDRLRRDRIRNEKSASRPESADLPHSAQSLFPRINPAWAVRRAVLPWVREPVDSATAYVRNGIASEAHVRNGGAKSHGRPYGGKFMRRRSSWTRGLGGEPGQKV